MPPGLATSCSSFPATMKVFDDTHAFAGTVIEQAATQLAVFVRPAKLADAEHLIHLNQAFRYEMAQWEAGVEGVEEEDEGYPVLDYDDVEYIITKEDPINLIVLGRRLENEERIIGYSYSYMEPWESAVSAPARRTRTGATPRKQPRKMDKSQPESESLYLAELFISEQERGLGLGELLLTGTLHARADCVGLSSHLFVSSKNVSAVKCYLKFGYDRGTRPSGDAAHDLVMEMRNCEEGVLRSVERLSQQLMMGTIGARRRRKPAAIDKKKFDKAASTSPTQQADSSRSASAASTASAHSICASPPPNVLKPRVCRATHFEADDASSRRNSRSERRSFELGNAVIPGRQRKPLRSIMDKSKTSERLCSHMKANAVTAGALTKASNFKPSSPNKLITRRMKRPKFMLTGMKTSAVANAKAVLSRLAGEVIDSEVYDPASTHVIASRAVRTEKFLCALAAGKPVLKASYVQDCESAGQLLPEMGYEWEACSARRPSHLFKRAPRGRPPTAKGSPTKASFASSGCFDGIAATLIISQEKQECFRRVLESGRATARSSASNKGIDGITHAFVSRDLMDPESESWTHSERRDALRHVEELQDAGVACYFENLIVDFLTGVNHKTNDYLVAEVTRTGKAKRKAGGVLMGSLENTLKKSRLTLLQPSH